MYIARFLLLLLLLEFGCPWSKFYCACTRNKMREASEELGSFLEKIGTPMVKILHDAGETAGWTEMKTEVRGKLCIYAMACTC